MPYDSTTFSPDKGEYKLEIEFGISRKEYKLSHLAKRIYRELASLHRRDKGECHRNLLLVGRLLSWGGTLR